MSGESSGFTQKGIAAVKAGNLSLARQLLDAALAENPDNVQAWLWMSGIVHTPAEKRQCLWRVLEIDPANAAAKRGLEALGPEPAAFATDSAQPHVSDPIHASAVERKDDTASRQAAAPAERRSNLLTVALIIAAILLLILILALLANRV
jgi:hypothetical protein